MREHDDLTTEVTTNQGRFAVHNTGATITVWDSSRFGKMLFLSRRSEFGPGSAIRGGIPICFPWFGVPRPVESGPSLLGRERAVGKHGFARTAPWQQFKAEQGQDGAWVVGYALTDADIAESSPKQAPPAPFKATFEAVFSETLLDLAFTVENTGGEAFLYEVALHAYFAVADVLEIELRGLDGVEYIDKVGADQVVTQHGAVTFGEEIDRVYPSAAPVEIVDPGLNREIRIVKENSGTTVVWNPGPQLAAEISDLGEDQWRDFVCVESANAYESAVTLEPGDEHTMRVRYEVGALQAG